METDIKQLISEALEARKSSYSPYSKYRVGAALLCDDGSIIRGCNIENASYGASVCAERCAAFKAVSSGKGGFSALAVAGGGEDEIEPLSDYAYPCGICRQVLREFVVPETFKIYVAKSVNDYREYTLGNLLPDSFGPDNLR